MATSFFERARDQLRLFAGNGYFWGGLLVLLLVLLVGYWIFNGIVMPSYTRHDAAIAVPDVTNESFEDARRQLAARNLQVERVVQQYDPQVPRDVVVEQQPVANEQVKPGRRVYVTINSGTIPEVSVPSIKNLSVREARNRVGAVGLAVGDVQADPVPAPYPNTVTRQEPAPGTEVDKGSAVNIWYSTGLSQEYVTLPDVTGQTVAEARETLLDNQLRAEVVGAGEMSPGEVAEQEVLRQSRQAGASLPAGSVIRLYLEEAEAP